MLRDRYAWTFRLTRGLVLAAVALTAAQIGSAHDLTLGAATRAVTTRATAFLDSLSPEQQSVAQDGVSWRRSTRQPSIC
jgi:hypothetical protein